MNIRTFKESDAQEVCDVLISSITHTFHQDYPNGSKEALQKWLGNKNPENVIQWMATAENKNVIVEIDSAIVGVGLISTRSGAIYLCYLLPKFIGQGIGKAMILELEKYAKEAGVEKICFSSTPSAEKFYKKWGAVRVGEEFQVSNDIANPVMEKLLP
jgi:GNAT superfamily N-acetyltransferase